MVGILSRKFYENLMSGKLDMLNYVKLDSPTKKLNALSNGLLPVIIRTLNFLEILSKPGHQEYGKLAISEVESLLKMARQINVLVADFEKRVMEDAASFHNNKL